MKQKQGEMRNEKVMEVMVAVAEVFVNGKQVAMELNK